MISPKYFVELKFFLMNGNNCCYFFKVVWTILSHESANILKTRSRISLERVRIDQAACILLPPLGMLSGRR